MLQTQSGGGAGETVVRERTLDSCDAALLADWTALAEVASEPCAFAESWFVVPALRAFGHHGIKLLEVRALTGELIGMMALEVHDKYGRIPVKHVRNWVHYQCFMGTPLVLAGAELQFWTAVLSWLDESDWAQAFLTMREMDPDGPVAIALHQVRTCDRVHTYSRALLSANEPAQTYIETHIRPKKRKELRRLAARLQDLGPVHFETLPADGALDQWCEDFLALEQAGWKGRDGAALANDPNSRAFLSEIVNGAEAAGRLDFQRLCLEGRPIAMLINFRTPPGSWSFKITYDETLARFSPGVMIELENLKQVIDNPDLEWMDSCAVPDHPMIDRLWAERRNIVQLTVPLAGTRRRLTHAICRSLENVSAGLRGLRG
jgi:CelD/BcsL family acetyltransferase involved in cellulose biosynthesis